MYPQQRNSLSLKIFRISPYSSKILMLSTLQLHCFHRPEGEGVDPLKFANDQRRTTNDEFADDRRPRTTTDFSMRGFIHVCLSKSLSAHQSQRHPVRLSRSAPQQVLFLSQEVA